MVRLGAVASNVAAVFDVSVASAAFLIVLTALTVLDVITVSVVGEVNCSLKDIAIWKKCPCMTYRRGTAFLVNHKGQIDLHKMVVHNLNQLQIRRS